MRIFIIFLISITSSVYTFGQIIIKGEISNSNSKELSINYLNQRSAAKAKINKGNFKLEVNLEQGYYNLKIGNESASIYLVPKDNLFITLDAEKFDETIKFSGIGSKRNNYLAKKQLITERAMENTNDFYGGTEEKYLQNISELNSKITDELKISNSEKSFIDDELKSIKYSQLLNLINYETFQDFYFGNKITASESFLSPLKNINFDNENEFQKQPYYRYLVSSKWKKDIEKAKDYSEKNKIFHSITSKSIKIDLLINFYYSISKDRTKAQDYFKLIKNNLPNNDFVKMAREKLKTTLKIKKGVKSPSFTYKDYNNKTHSLSDFKGKYVFIDVWATWCGPCVKQIPYLKELEHLYSNKDIVFVSISVDRPEAYEKWKKMISEKKLGGVQLFADKSFDSKFIKAYGISSIPRFILLDKEGKILNENTDKPSTEKLKNTLKALFE